MIESIQKYIEQCPYLDKFIAINVNYLVDKVKAYSITEEVGYDPIISKDILGNKLCQFQFSFDAKLYWNDEVANNINNSKFFEQFREWLEENDKNKIFPEIEGITILSISATTNGYLFATNTDEAIYRISCIMKYLKKR